MNAEKCFKQNIHGRSLEDIKKSVDRFEPTPESNLILNPSGIFEYEKKKEETKKKREDEVKMEMEKQKKIEQEKLKAEIIEIDDEEDEEVFFYD
jgi:hypothetical protein